MALMLVLTGTGHFLVPGPVDQLIPPFLPGEPRVWTYLSGVAEIVVALMLLAWALAKDIKIKSRAGKI